MFKLKKNVNPDWDLEKLTDEQLSQVPLAELQRIRNKRWAHGLEYLEKRASEELARRDPKKNWSCNRCGNTKFHQKEMRASSGFWESTKYHALICNYCGKTEFYSVLLSPSEASLDILGG